MDPASEPAADPIRLTLELVPGREPIAGSIRAPGGPARPFSGWIDLVATLEEALDSRYRPSGPGQADAA